MLLKVVATRNAATFCVSPPIFANDCKEFCAVFLSQVLWKKILVVILRPDL